MKKYVIKNGWIVDPLKESPEKSDLLVENGVIARISDCIDDDKAEIYDASGKFVCPGFIDLESHILKSFQDVDKALQNASGEALKGGFTTVCAMSDTSPPLDNEGMIGIVRFLSEKREGVRVIPAACATKSLKGQTMSEIGTLIDAGAGLIYDASKTILDTLLLRHILNYSRMFKVPFFLHSEDESLSKDGLIHESETSTRLGLMGIPSVAEDIVVARDLILAEYLGVAVHFAHMTTKGSIEMIRGAKKRGIKVTCHVTPHHLSLTNECLTSFNTNFKIKPPLRSETDRLSLINGILDGTVDAVATHHFPCSKHSKEVEFAEAPFGVIGLETAFPVLFDEFVDKKILSVNRVVKLLTSSPADILNIQSGFIRTSMDADITICSSCPPYVLTRDLLVSKTDNTPFLGRKFTSRIDACMVRGIFRYRDGQLFI